MVDAVARDFHNEQAAHDEAIHKLKRGMIVLIETTFGADFDCRILAAIRPVQDQLSSIQNQLDFTSSGVDDRITVLEEEDTHLTGECAEIINLLAVYANRLE